MVAPASRYRLWGKTAIVTGGSRGVGRAIAEGFATEGATVVVNYHEDQTAARKVVEAIEGRGGRALALQADISRPEEVARLVERSLAAFGDIHVLVNNASICPFESFFDVTPDRWDRVIGTNLRGTFLCTQAVARVMVDRGIAGRIVTVSSIAALFCGGPLQVPYAASKAGQHTMMLALANVLGPHGITCNTLMPGTVLTDINRELLADPAIEQHYVQRIPAGRLGQPADLVGAALFLASDESAYVNGAQLTVDGGALARRV